MKLVIILFTLVNLASLSYAQDDNHLLFQDEENNFREIKEAYNRVTPQQLKRIKVVNLGEHTFKGWVFKRSVISERSNDEKEPYITHLKKITVVAGGNCVIIAKDLHQTNIVYFSEMKLDAFIAEDCVKRH